jgi:imidazolonepropionase
MVVLKNIKRLYGITADSILLKSGSSMKTFDFIDHAFLAIDNGVISDYGPMLEGNKLPQHLEACQHIDGSDKFVLPGWCDSHTHIVFAATREEEFADRINGLTYEEIALRGGGILNSARKLAAMSEDALFETALERVHQMIAKGTTSIEIKSGYGLSLKNEIKMLRVIQRLKQQLPLIVKATFLGAHAIPEDFINNRKAYVDLILNEMLPAIATEKLADYCDVFCERNYFSSDETVQILNTAVHYGLKAKVHANQLSRSGGVQAGVKCNAISVDHLEFVEQEEIDLLKQSATMPVVLPGAAFFLGLPLPPARRMIDAGLPLAVATDFNPGSSPSGDMNFMISLLCIQYKLTPEEAFNAATINGAYAINSSHITGSIAKGKRADIIITKKIPSLYYLPYAFNDHVVESVYVNGIKYC